MGRLMDESDFNPNVARARREAAQREEAGGIAEVLSNENTPPAENLSEEH